MSNDTIIRDITRKDRSSGRYHEGDHHFEERPGVVQNGRRFPMALAPIPGTPVAAVAAFGTTTMSGVNNDWDMLAVTKGAVGNTYSLRVVIDDAKADAPSVAIDGGAVTITAGAKARMHVQGDFGSGPTDIILEWSGDRWTNGLFELYNDQQANNWLLQRTDFSVGWGILKTQDFPDQEDWGLAYPVGTPVGFPTVTALTHTAAQCKTAFDATTANETFYTLTNKSGNDGTGAVVAHGPVQLSGGIDGTVAAKGTQMFDDTNIYLATSDTKTSDSSGWRKIAHSAL